MADRPRILVLGGTSEGFRTARALAGRCSVTYALAGRTATPALPAGAAVRVGGFGGAAGLADWIEREAVSAIVDATHPFASAIAANAAEAAARTRTPRLKIVRPAWTEAPGDRWRHARDVEEAARMVGETDGTVFLAIGVRKLAALAGLAERRFVVRTIDPDAEIPFADAVRVTGRGPFSVGQETALLRRHGVDVVVTRNSGGAATYAKLAAARETGLPVIMIARPPLPQGEVRAEVRDAVAWASGHLRSA